MSMSLRWLRRRASRAVLLGAALLSALVWPTAGLARGGPGRGPGPGPGPIMDRLPPGHGSARIHGETYFYHGGNFFRPRPRGYVWVTPPPGLVITRLPPGYATLVIGGLTYFTYLGVYYQRVPAGFVVVNPPAGAGEPVVTGSSVIVTAASLNVRQGPGLDQAVVAVVPRGTVLTVQGAADGWLYVLLPGGQYGWVGRQYTTPATASPSG